MGKHIHLPAPTAWPIVLAFGCTWPPPDSSPARPSARSAACSWWPAASAGSGRCCRTKRTRMSEILDQPIVVVYASRSSSSGSAWNPEHRAHAARRNLSRRQRHQGRHRRRIRHDRSRHHLRPHRTAQHLVSRQSAGRRRRCQLAQSYNRRNCRVSLAGLLVAIVDSCGHVPAGGLLYGAMLPMLPRHPVLLGGILAPLLWTGLLHRHGHHQSRSRRSHRMGLVRGIAGHLRHHRRHRGSAHERIPTGQSLPFVARMGIEAPGLMHSRPDVGAPREREKH